MKTLKTLCAAIAAGVLFASTLPAMAADEGWTVDFKAAGTAAAAEKKDLFLEFTGSDWCPPCKAQKAQIFDSEHFRKEAPNYFVLVKLDFPRDKSKQTQAEIAQNQELQKHYGVTGYPTVILADPTGKPYAKMVGFGGSTPEVYTENLKKLQTVRVKRDTAMAKAATATGLDKAKLLDEAIGGIDSELACSTYKEEVAEIIKLDANNEAGLKAKYEGVLMSKEVKAKVEELMRGSGNDPAKALREIDAYIAEKKLSGENLQQALLGKANLTFRTDQTAAIKHLEEAVNAAPDSQLGQQLKNALERMKAQQGK